MKIRNKIGSVAIVIGLCLALMFAGGNPAQAGSIRYGCSTPSGG